MSAGGSGSGPEVHKPDRVVAKKKWLIPLVKARV